MENNSNLEKTLEEGKLFRYVNNLIVAHLRDNNLTQLKDKIQIRVLKGKETDPTPDVTKYKRRRIIPDSEKLLFLAHPTSTYSPLQSPVITTPPPTTTTTTHSQRTTPPIISIAKTTPTPPPFSQITTQTPPDSDMSLDEMCDLLYATLLSKEQTLDIHDKAVLVALQSRKFFKEQEADLCGLKQQVEEEREAQQRRIREHEQSCRSAVFSVRREDPDSEDRPEGENTGEDHTEGYGSDKTEELNIDEVMEDVEVDKGAETDEMEMNELESQEIVPRDQSAGFPQILNIIYPDSEYTSLDESTDWRIDSEEIVHRDSNSSSDTNYKS